MARRKGILGMGAALVLGLVLAACEQESSPAAPAAPPPADTAHAPAAIAWHAGTVDDAFAAARRDDKPVFLYWGAEWCPPCNFLKATVFRRPDFIEKTRFFVPVYIDGDGEGAQALQDRFGAMGYPTLIVFDSHGTELTRIPGGMDLARYMDVFDLALEKVQPVGSIVHRLLEENGSASAAEWRLLSTYSWRQDAGRVLGDRAPASVLHGLMTRAPKEMVAERAVLASDWLVFMASAPEAPDEATAAEARTLVREILASDEASVAARDLLGPDLGDVLERIAPEPGPERDALLAQWEQRLSQARAGPLESGSARLWLLGGEVALAKQRGDLDQVLLERVKAEVDAEVAAATDEYSRSAVLNAALWVLDGAELTDHAMELLRAQLADEHFGYYWMLDLASFAEDSGRTDEALDWLKRAFEGAEGRATRIQWGSVYVAGLARMAPADTTTIDTTLGTVLGELEAQPKSLHGRNRQALERIHKALEPWAANDDARTAMLTAARARLATHCDTEFAGDTAARTSCSQLL